MNWVKLNLVYNLSTTHTRGQNNCRLSAKADRKFNLGGQKEIFLNKKTDQKIPTQFNFCSLRS